jgi:hypothetical protein
MRLYIDTVSQSFVTDPAFRAPVDSATFKRGDAAQVNIQFSNGSTVLSAVSGRDLKFGIKASGDYDGDYIVFTEDYTINGNDYVLNPSFNTEALNLLLGHDPLSGNVIPDVAAVDAMLEVSWSDDSGTSWYSTNTITATINNDVNKGSEGTPIELPDALDWLQANGIVYETAITSLTGGTSTYLDALVTTGIPVGSLYAVKGSGNNLSIYRMADSTSTTSVPLRIRPLDYNNPDNKKVWFLAAPQVASLRSYGQVLATALAIENSSGNAITLYGDEVTAETDLQLPDVSGHIPSVPPYADLTAANAALDSGDFFWDTTLKKLRQATA